MKLLSILFALLFLVACDGGMEQRNNNNESDMEADFGHSIGDATTIPDVLVPEDFQVPFIDAQTDAGPDQDARVVTVADFGTDDATVPNDAASDALAPDAAPPPAPGHIEVHALALDPHPQTRFDENGVQIVDDLGVQIQALPLSAFEICYRDGQGLSASLQSVVVKTYGHFGFTVGINFGDRSVRRYVNNGNEFQFNLVNEDDDEPLVLEDETCEILTLDMNLPFNDGQSYAYGILPAVTGVVTLENLDVVFNDDAQRARGTHTIFQPTEGLTLTPQNLQHEPVTYLQNDQFPQVAWFEICSEDNARANVSSVTLRAETQPGAELYPIDFQVSVREVDYEGFSLDGDGMLLGQEGDDHIIDITNNGEPRNLSYGRCLSIYGNMPFVPQGLEGIRFSVIDVQADAPVQVNDNNGNLFVFEAPAPWNWVQFIPPPEGVGLALEDWSNFGLWRSLHFLWAGTLNECIDDNGNPLRNDVWACPIRSIHGTIGGADPEDSFMLNSMTYRTRFDRTSPDQENLVLVFELQKGGRIVVSHEVEIAPGEWGEFDLPLGVNISRQGNFQFQMDTYVQNEELPEARSNAAAQPRLELELIGVDIGVGAEIPISMRGPDEENGDANEIHPLDEIFWPVFHFGAPELELVSVDQIPPDGEFGFVSIMDWMIDQVTTLMRMNLRTPNGPVTVCSFSFRHGTGKFRPPAADMVLDINGTRIGNLSWDDQFVIFRAASPENCIFLRGGSRHWMTVTMGEPLSLTNIGEPIQLRLVGIEAYATDHADHLVNLRIGTTNRGEPIWLSEGDSVSSYAVEIIP